MVLLAVTTVGGPTHGGAKMTGADHRRSYVFHYLGWPYHLRQRRFPLDRYARGSSGRPDGCIERGASRLRLSGSHGAARAWGHSISASGARR